jgi:hypothetical protein
MLGSRWSVLALASALTLVMETLNWTVDIGFNLARDVGIMVCKFLFGVKLFLILPHIRYAFVKYHVLPESHIDLVLIFCYQYEVGIIELVDLVCGELGVTVVYHSINHVQGLKLLLPTASTSVTAALRSISLPAAAVAFGLIGFRRHGSVALSSILAKLAGLVSALLRDHHRGLMARTLFTGLLSGATYWTLMILIGGSSSPNVASGGPRSITVWLHEDHMPLRVKIPEDGLLGCLAAKKRRPVKQLLVC